MGNIDVSSFPSIGSRLAFFGNKPASEPDKKPASEPDKNSGDKGIALLPNKPASTKSTVPNITYQYRLKPSTANGMAPNSRNAGNWSALRPGGSNGKMKPVSKDGRNARRFNVSPLDTSHDKMEALSKFGREAVNYPRFEVDRVLGRNAGHHREEIPIARSIPTGQRLDPDWARKDVKLSIGATPTGDQGVGTVSDADKQAFKIAAGETRDRLGAFDSFASLVRRVMGPFRDLGAAFGKLVSRMANKLLTLSGRQTAEAKAAADAKAAKAMELNSKINEVLDKNPESKKSVLSAPGFLRENVSTEARNKRLNAPDEYYANVEAVVTSSKREKLDDQFCKDLGANYKLGVADAFTKGDHSQYDHLVEEFHKRNEGIVKEFQKNGPTKDYKWNWVPSKEELPAPLKDLYNLGVEVLDVNNPVVKGKRTRAKGVVATNDAMSRVIHNTPGGADLDSAETLTRMAKRKAMIFAMLENDVPFASERKKNDEL